MVQDLGPVQGLQSYSTGSSSNQVKEETLTEGYVRDIHQLITAIEQSLEVVLSPETPTPQQEYRVHNAVHGQLVAVVDRLVALKNRINL